MNTPPPPSASELRQQAIAVELRRQDPARYPNTEAGGHRAMEDAAEVLDIRARIAAAVMAEREEIFAAIGILAADDAGYAQKAGVSPEAETLVQVVLLATLEALRTKPAPEGTDHLAAQLAAAEARGLQRAIAALEQPITVTGPIQGPGGIRRVMNAAAARLRAMLPHQLEGGADNAG